MSEMMIPKAQNVLSALPTVSLADFQREVFSTETNFLTRASQRAGMSDTIMHIGEQLTSEMVVDHVLTIIRVSFVTVPRTENGKVVVGANGEPEYAQFPVCHFAEAPGYWYNGGRMLLNNIRVWAAEVGEDLSDPSLPKLNQALTELGGIRAFFCWKDKRDGSGQRYVNIILA